MLQTENTEVSTTSTESASTTTAGKTTHSRSTSRTKSSSSTTRKSTSTTSSKKTSATTATLKDVQKTTSDSTATLQVTDSAVGKTVADSLQIKVTKKAKQRPAKKVVVELTGTKGEPVPYNVAGDNLVTCLLIVCFIVATTAFTRASNVFFRNAKSFFFVQRGLTTIETETNSEFRFQLSLIAETCLLYALMYFFYIREYITDTFIIPQYQIIGIFTLVFMAYFAVRTLLYTLTNWVFFNKKNNDQWMRANVFMMGTEGLLLLPLVLLLSYFNLSAQTAIVYVIIVIGLVKLSCFYKSYLIFFNRKDYFLQNVLYFCGIEIVPLIGLWEILLLISDNLKTNI